MKERPILFNGEMVRALLAGRKTETRRVVKPQPEAPASIFNVKQVDTKVIARLYDGGCKFTYSMSKCGSISHKQSGNTEFIKCPYGKVGDKLWVRETFRLFEDVECGCSDFPCPCPPTGTVIYCADYYKKTPKRLGLDDDAPKWQPSIFMPRKFSRITLEITDVRVERLQDITEEGALAEGIEYSTTGDDLEGDTMYYAKNYGATGKVSFSAKDNPDLDEDLLDTDLAVDPLESFKGLWDSINGKNKDNNWQSSPWVWVIEFKRMERTS